MIRKRAEEYTEKRQSFLITFGSKRIGSAKDIDISCTTTYQDFLYKSYKTGEFIKVKIYFVTLNAYKKMKKYKKLYILIARNIYKSCRFCNARVIRYCKAEKLIELEFIPDRKRKNCITIKGKK